MSIARYPFNYPQRAAMLADGWDFLARTADGAVRDTEQAGEITYSKDGISIPAGTGDLWKGYNNTRNSVFRDLPQDWVGVELTLSFAPSEDYQQAGIAVYGSDDDYLQVIRQYNSWEGNQSVGFVTESDQRVVRDRYVKTTATSLKLRLVRSGDTVTGSFSADDGDTWTTIGSAVQRVTDPRLGIIVGANASGGADPVATVYEAAIAVSGPQPSASETPSASPSPTPTPTPTPSPTPTVTPSPSPTPTPSLTPTPSVSPSVTPTPPVVSGFPTRANTGVPAGWSPKRELTGDYTITQDGAVVEDLRLTGGTLYVRAENVTLRRVQILSGQINNVWSRVCYNGLRIEDSTILRGTEDIGQPAVQFGGYTALRTKIDGPSEGFRVGGADFGCDPVVIQDSFVNVEPYIECGVQPVDWHGDGIQGYNGPAVTVRNTYVRLGRAEGCGGNSPFFYPVNQGNARATIDGLLVSGGGFSFRLEMPGSVTGLKVVDDSWTYGPVFNRDACGQIAWGPGNEIVAVNPDGSLRSVRSLSCSGN